MSGNYTRRAAREICRMKTENANDISYGRANLRRGCCFGVRLDKAVKWRDAGERKADRAMFSLSCTL